MFFTFSEASGVASLYLVWGRGQSNQNGPAQTKLILREDPSLRKNYVCERGAGKSLDMFFFI